MAYGSGSSSQPANVVAFPDLKPGGRRELLGQEIGTQFDQTQRLFAYYGEGDVFDYGEFTARDMKAMFRRDGICSAMELVLTLPIREADYELQPAKGDKGETDFVRSVIMTPDCDGGMKTPISQLVGQVTSAQIFRRAFFEKVFTIRESDGKIIYDKVAFRPASTCQARYNDRTAAANGFRQQVWLFGGSLMLTSKQKVPGYVDIPHIRSYIYTHNKHREPLTGAGEMDIAYWCYQTKMKLLYLWYYFLENLSMQRVVAYGNDQSEANTRADDIASMRGAGVVGLVHPPDGQKAFEVLGGGADAGTYFSQALGFLEGWQTHSVLAGFMALTGSATGGKGSYALSQDQSSFYLKSRQAVAKEIAESLSFDVIRPLVVLNFGTSAAYPTFKFGPLQDEQIQALLTMFQTLSTGQVLHIPLPVLDLITERMASVLQLDIDQVHQALVSTANQRAEQLMSAAPPGMPQQAASALGQMNGAVSAAANMAQRAQAGQPPLPGRPSATNIPLGGSGPPTPPSKPPMVPPPGQLA
jgi:Protein of unknown function (DUF935)